MAKRTPKYSLHKPTGQAYVRINGKFHYLGEHKSPESHERYNRLIAQWLGSTFNADREKLTISRLGILYVEFARQYYRKNGEQTSELHCIQLALRPLIAKCGREKVSNFGARRLKDVREAMIGLSWSRTGINAAVQRINRMIRWGVENELVRPEVYQACRAVTGLRLGRSEARETEPVKPVPQRDIDAVESFVSSQIWAMIQLQLVTGMRPGEVCLMRLVDICMTGDVWEYRPSEHKTEHHGRQRLIFLGPKAQAIMQPYLTADRTRFLFSPADAQAERKEKRRQNRQSPMTPSQQHRERKKVPIRAAGNHYRRDSYSRAITRACKLAKVTVWAPNRLRHNAATELRKRYGLEGTRTVLGHSTTDMTSVYAELDFDAAKQIMRSVG
ncbi:MAG: site-specific integrase [Planctomycetaceae bacterium]